MAVTAFWYGNAFVSAFNKLMDVDTDVIKALLTTSSYSVSQDNHDFYNDVTNEVANGNGYTTGGTTITSITASTSQYTGGTNVWAIDGDDAVWSSSSITARLCVVYDSSPGTAATDPLISYVDFGGDNTTSSGTFTVAWNASGIVKVTVS